MNLTNPVFYNNGVAGASAVVGVSEQKPRNVRYGFTSPATGASQLSLQLGYNASYTGGTVPQRLRFALTTDPEAYGAADWSTLGTGVLERSGSAYTASVRHILLPETTYYLFVWPATATFGWVSWLTGQGAATLTLSGGACSVLSAPEGTVGSPLTLTVTQYDPDFTHCIRYGLGTESGLVYEGSDTQPVWTPPLALCAQAPTEEAVTVNLTLETLARTGESLGTYRLPVRLAIPETVRPTVDFVWQDQTGATATYGSPVQNISALTVTPTAAGSYGSTVVATAVSLDGAAYTGGVLTGQGTAELAVTVTDSRGRSATATQTLEVLAYRRPTLELTASRCDAGGTADDEGEYALVTLTGTVAPLQGQNSAALVLTWQSGADGAVYERTVQAEAQFAYSWVIDAPSVATLQLKATVTDRLTATERSTVLSVGYATLDLLAGGRGIAFGTTATQEGFTCAMPARFTGGIAGALPALESEEHPGCYYRLVEGEREWINPPRLLSTEYRTTGRWQGKPIYSKCAPVGTLPAAGGYQTAYELATGVDTLVSALFLAKSSSASYVSLPNFTWYLGSYGQPYVVMISGNEDHSGKEGYVYMEYTK